MKRFLAMLLAFVLLLAAAPLAQAADDSKSFMFELSVSGKNQVNVESGDTVTVDFWLKRTDVSEAYVMHAVQNEIRYDSRFFRLVEDSVQLSSGLQYTDIGLANSEFRELYINYVHPEQGGIRWNPALRMGSFQLEVIGTEGSSTISCQDYQVSTADGSDSYNAGCQNVTVTIKTGGAEPSPSPSPNPVSYTVSFRANGGSTVAAQSVEAGNLITMPNNPTRTGYTFVGWYKNSALTQAWDFDTDTVTANTTLYAKWQRNTGSTSGTGTGTGTGGTGTGTATTPKPSASVSPSPSVSPTVTPSASPTVTPSASSAISEAPVLGVAPNKTTNNTVGNESSLTVIDEGEGCRFPWWLWLILLLLLLLLLLLIIFLLTRKTVEFVTEGGEEVPIQKVRKGGKIRRPQEPQKAGRIFAGWFADEARTQRWDFEENAVEDNMSLYAKWL